MPQYCTFLIYKCAKLKLSGFFNCQNATVKGTKKANEPLPFYSLLYLINLTCTNCTLKPKSPRQFCNYSATVYNTFCGLLPVIQQ